jgi:hypothetical protein
MGKCFEGLAKVLKALSIKKCHSSCCQIDMEGNSVPASPISKDLPKMVKAAQDEPAVIPVVNGV